MHRIPFFLRAIGLYVATAASSAIAMPPVKPVDQVDLPRFMGSWYVIATIPSVFEKNAVNAVETYKLSPDGTIATDYRYRKRSLDAPVKHIGSTGFVREGTNNAVWGVRIVWPVKAQYVIAYLSPDYQQTIIARDARDYVWIMARTPTISQPDYDALVARVRDLGYKVADIQKVQQVWPEPEGGGL
ncbi:apolipoprotein D and lipocalin family protein [Luteibacter sp. Sphag1AF]|uniref:lipocalin family protein n=1 Tax=Luteibacter sp. Sphag1AF TaxID=2587031 RepID=UPI0018207360|nr:lipocalin family protein [Luteibacter sp. Sphag1AF]MBB3226477.1 apolipoprotein D and lipocalin family protein [Luteibacter sp. Sphag1AF]